MAGKKHKVGTKSSAGQSPLPGFFKPMLATLIDEPFHEPGWTYEIKWDGYRALSFLNKGSVEILSRNNKPFDEKFYPIHQSLSALPIKAVVDGEIVVLTNNGVSDFGALQNWRSEADGQLIYYLFDIIWYEGQDLKELPLIERREILKRIVPNNDDTIRISESFKENGVDFYNAAYEMGLEGIIAKKEDSIYSPDLRSKDWLKVKTSRFQEAIICGFTKNKGRKRFSSLMMGVYNGKELHYIGLVGTGFSDKLQSEILEKLDPLITPECPFPTVPEYNKPSRFRPNPPAATATWVKPQIVAEVSYTEITKDGVMRHPSFKGLREDKNPKDIVWEKPKQVNDLIKEDNILQEQKLISSPKETSRKTLLNPKDETQVRSINGHELKFTNLSKLYWPEEGISKRDMLNYYYQIAPVIIPYLKDRPQSLNRFPNGIHGKSFYQKNISGKAPEWVSTFPYRSEGIDKEFLVGSDEASLLLMASLGAIEMNPWFSRVQSPDNPDWCIIDLDPDKNTFDQVISAALEVKKVLDAIDVPSYCKTSGSTGMHIYIPLGAKYSYDESQMFARLIVNIVHRQIPEYTSIERKILDRGGKMYLDFLQNRPQATIAAPYSLRPKPGATVSMPLHWEEVKPGLKMKDFNIFNAVDRVKLEGDLFKGTLSDGIDLKKTIDKADTIFK